VSRRHEFVNDPDAPKATRIVPATSAVVESGAGILMHRRSDSNLWALPGGAVEPGESVLTALVREVREETGFNVRPGRLVGIYSDPGYVIAYDDGEVRQQFSMCFAAEVTDGELRISDESTDVQWIPRADVATLSMGRGLPTGRRRARHRLILELCRHPDEGRQRGHQTARDDVVGAVALDDLVAPHHQRHRLTVGTGREIDPRHRREQPLGRRRIGLELGRQAAQLCLPRSGRVMRHQAGELLLTKLAEVGSTVEVMAARPDERLRVADVVDPRRGHDALETGHAVVELLSSPRDHLDVMPTTHLSREQTAGEAFGGIGGQHTPIVHRPRSGRKQCRQRR
jgi:ADP-ribose pyrophosphatase YjhB (NUDIX family)